MSKLRKQIEICVTSTNTVLKGQTAGMSLITLLRNCHPSFAAFYARILKDEGALTEVAASEFTKLESAISRPAYNYLVYQPNLLRR